MKHIELTLAVVDTDKNTRTEIKRYVDLRLSISAEISPKRYLLTEFANLIEEFQAQRPNELPRG